MLFLTADDEGLLVLRTGPQLQAYFGQDAEGAIRPAQDAGQVVSGDVLDDPAAGANALAPAVDELGAEDVFAQRTRLESPRAGKPAGDRASERRARAPVRRLEGQMLVFCREHLLHMRQRRPGAGDEDELLRFVRDDAAQAAHIDGHVGVDGTPQRHLRPAAGEAQTASGGAHDLLEGVDVGRMVR